MLRKKNDQYRHLKLALVAFIVVISIGTAGYMIIERLDFLEALYMTIITISTVGYREIAPKPSAAGEIFTIILIICGLATVVYFTTSVVEMLIEGRILEIMGRRKFLRELKELSGHYIICGYGRVGKQIAGECQHRGASVVIIERDNDTFESCINDGYIAIKGDATDEQDLRKAGIENAKGLVTAVSSDADNLFVTMTARIIRPDLFIVGRCNSDHSESKLYRAGADRALSPHNVGGRRMAALVLKPLVCDFLDVVTHGDLVELTLDDVTVRGGSPTVGRKIKEIVSGEFKGIIILGIKRIKREYMVNPGGDTIIETGDILIISGPEELRKEFLKLCQLEH
ncbi:MAG: potassium channel protein [Actinobacteria bacterium]|nr:potassium channel protein [Actinomycetota bacterium]